MLPIPPPSEMTRQFWEAVREGRLLVPECQSCGRRFFNPEPACIFCWATGWTWVPSPGTGRIYTMSVVHQAIVPGQPVPFVLAAVDMDDGWTLMTHIVGVPIDQVHIDMPVRFEPTELHDGFYLPTFTPIG